MERQGVMIAMGTRLPLYGVSCLVALVPVEVMIVSGKERERERERGGNEGASWFRLIKLHFQNGHIHLMDTAESS